uniref:Ovule protein n=1 Tax=Brugia timori TaxID=42155 RepID=A0A0R3RD99_9BILA
LLTTSASVVFFNSFIKILLLSNLYHTKTVWQISFITINEEINTFFSC